VAENFPYAYVGDMCML